MKSQESTLHSDRKKALGIVITQSILLIAYLVIEIINAQKFTTLSLVLLYVLIGVILILSFYGANIIFYIDQERLGLYKLLNITTYIMFGVLVVTQQFLMREIKFDGSLETQFIVAGVIVLIILILDIFLLMLTNNLTTKWRRASERSQIKSAVFDRESYESMLQNSLILKGHANNA